MRSRNKAAILAIAVWAYAAAFGNLSSSEPTTTWVSQKQVGRFHIHSDFALADNEPLLGELGNITQEVSRLLAIPGDDQPVHVVLFSNSKEYGRYIKCYFPTVPERRALYIQHRGPGMLFAHWHENVRVDIRHEVVHALLNSQSNPLPLWLDEGLAEYFEVVEADRMHANPHLPHVFANAQQGYVPVLEDLERLTTIEQLGTQQYRDSWAWVHFLLHRRAETRKLLVDQLALHRSNPNTKPLSRTIDSAIPNWREEFIEHFKTLAATSPAAR